MKLTNTFIGCIILTLCISCKPPRQVTTPRGGEAVLVGAKYISSPVMISKNTIYEGETIILRNGGFFQIEKGAELTVKSKLIVETNNLIFKGKGKVRFSSGAVESINPKWWGAKGDNKKDNYQAIQNALDCAIYSKGVSKVKLDAGMYRLTKPLIAGKVENNRYQFFNLTFEGIQSTFDHTTGLGASSILIADFSDSFILGIQSSRGVEVRNLAFIGKNKFDFNLKEVYEKKSSNWKMKQVRDSKYSPYSAIVIDPFKSGVPEDGGYPRLKSSYIGGSGSTAIKIINCKISNFICGIIISPNGKSLQADNIQVNNCFIDYCKVGIAICQGQSRTLQVNNLAANRLFYLFDALSYGQGQGVLPEVNVLTGSQIKWLFKCSAGFAYGHFKNIYVEEIYGIGFSANPYGHMPMKFEQCTFHFSYPVPVSHKNTKANPALLQVHTASFDGCRIGYDTDAKNVAPLNFDVVSLNFDNCSIDQPIINSNLDKHQKIHNTRYNNVRFRCIESLEGITSDGTLYHIKLENANGCLLAPGQNLVDDNGMFYKNKGNGMDFYQTEDRININVDEFALTASFKTSNPGLYRLGDQLLIDLVNDETGIGNTVRTSFGAVKEVNGNIVIIGGITYGLVSCTSQLFSSRLPYFKENTIGSIKKGSQTITNIMTESPLGGVWKPGDKINGEGIIKGTYVVTIDAPNNQITISHPADMDAVNIALFDAPLHKEATISSMPKRGVWKKGDKVINDLSRNTDIYAWVCTQNGSFHHYTKPVFKPIMF